MPFGGGPVSSRPKWRLSACSAPLPRLGRTAGENGDEADASIRALDEAIERATALEAPYELALSLANRVAISSLAVLGVASGHTIDDRDRAETIFEGLGVTQAVITWSAPGGGGPLFARRPAPPG